MSGDGDTFVTFVRRAARVVSTVGIAVLVVVGALYALMFGAVAALEAVDVKTVHLTDIPERSAGRWELDGVTGLDPAYAEWFGDEIELRWEGVAPEGDDDGVIATGTLVQRARELPIEMRRRDRVPTHAAAGIDRGGGAPLDGEHPGLAILVRRNGCGLYERLYVLPHGVDARGYTRRSLCYTRVD